MVGPDPKYDALLQPLGAAGPPGAAPASERSWEASGDLGRVAFATVWTTGPDPRSDGVFRIQAIRRAAAASGERSAPWERLDLYADPFADRIEDGRTSVASARMAREFGVTRGDLEGAPPAGEALDRLAEFVGGRPLVVVDATTFRAWLGAGRRGAADRVFDLTSLAALLTPGRLASEGEELPLRLLDPKGSPGRAGERNARALDPEELRTALAVLVGRVLSRDEPALAVLAHALTDVETGIRGWEPERADELTFALRLLEHPSRWRGERDELYPEHEALSDGRLSDVMRVFDTLEDAVEAALPPWGRESHREAAQLPSFAEQLAPLDALDRKLVDDVFRSHLPRRLGRPSDEGGESFRAGQHGVATRIASSFGQRELLLVHAPTGTGKTLAYLVPTMLWSFRNGVRIGVATFTRALQEQAMARDVPLALEMLKLVGVTGVRVSVLKGRRNYLCWRALMHQLPKADAPADELFAWTTLALFALMDDRGDDGDLDRLALRAPLSSMASSTAGARWRACLERYVRLVRAETGCCALADDRATCAAEAARRKAERSHVVVTNHAFALARREFFRHIVFDECEHLHDVAHNAFSSTTGVRRIRALLARLHAEPTRGAGEGSMIVSTSARGSGAGSDAGSTAGTASPSAQTPLDQLAAAATHMSPAWVAAQECLEARRDAHWALNELENATEVYKVWRDRELSGRKPSDSHSLFREYVESGEAQALLDAHDALRTSLNEMSAALQRLSEHLDTLPGKVARRLRRPLEIQRTELDEHLGGVEAWIPRNEARRPAFRTQTFHDLETNQRGDDVLAARVLLPHEFLGRHYYPDLAGAVFLSATTWLGGGFDASLGYLGLARAAEPAEDEERDPSRVATYRAPEAFDYSRVLALVPRDAPAISMDKRGFLDYTARFVTFLAERTRGRMLVLFTNADDLSDVGRRCERFFAERSIPFWHQRMGGTSKEELGELFRTHTDSVLFGLDTFWYGTDFPGETLEYVVLVRLPYGVPDRYHEAQCAALGKSEQRKRIYMPRALAKFRQGFGRLMRRETDKGCVFVLDKRILDPRHRAFLKELPLRDAFADAAVDTADDELSLQGATLVTGDTDRCLDAALAHMDMKTDVRRRRLERSFVGWRMEQRAPIEVEGEELDHRESEIPTIATDDVPY